MTGTAKVLLAVVSLAVGTVIGFKAWQVFGQKKPAKTPEESKKEEKAFKASGTWAEDHSKYIDSQKRVWYLTGIAGRPKVPLGGTGAYVEVDLEADFKSSQKPESVVYAMLWDGSKSPHSDSEWDKMQIASFSKKDADDYEFLGQTMDEVTGDFVRS